MCDIMPELNKLAKIFQLNNFDYAKVNDLLKALHMYFDTLISNQDKAKSFQEAGSALASLSDFVTKVRGQNSDNFDFYKDIPKPYLRSLKSNLEKRFPSMEIVEAFGILNQQHATEHDLYETGMQRLHSLLYFTGKTL